MIPLRRALALSLVFSAACADDPGRDEVAIVAAPICVEHSPTTFGIDVSKWQGTIDWARVAAAGVKYAFIRVSDGITTIDERFPANWAGAAQHGIPRGVYQFFRPNRDAIEQAQIVLDHLAIHGMGELPPVIDVEATGEQSPEVIAAQVGLWIDEIETTLGVRPIIYSGSYFWDDFVKTAAFSDYPFWIAHYTSASCPRLPQAWSDWTFWQYSSTGRVDGINGDVDMNRFAGTVEDLAALVPDETCRLDPDYRACDGAAEVHCVDGRLVANACLPGATCRDGECVADQPEPGPEHAEPPVEPVEPGPEPVELVEPPPEPVEPAPDVVEPVADTQAGADTALEVSAPDTATPSTAGTPGVPARTLSGRTLTPSEGCAGGSPEASLPLLVVALLSVRRRHRA